MNQKGFISPLLLALVAILVIGGGAYAYVQNKQANQPVVQTSDWKTYTNTKYGFEFKYPDINARLRTIGGWTDSNEPKITLRTPFNYNECAEVDVISKSKITIAGREYCLLTQSAKEPDPDGGVYPLSSAVYEYVFHIGNEDIGIVFTTSWGSDGQQVDKEAYKKIDSLFSQILSTLKFTTQTTSTAQTSDWKTYSNIQFNYKLLYPSNATLSSHLNDYATDRDMNVQSEVEFGVEGVATLLGVSMSWPGVRNEQKQLLSPNDLKSFANSVREMQVTDPNPNSADRKIGPLQETTLGGTKAYSFTLTDSFNDISGGYTLGDKSKYIYVIAQNLQGQKVVLHYLAGSTDAERMAQSFEFTK